MSLPGTGALAMWWDIAADVRADFEDWHSHEHFPERLGVPGFRRASRWTSATDDDGIFVMYELDAHHILSSPGYLARLNAPTPWSATMMPHHRNMVRAQCHVLETAGGSVARQALTIRLSPETGREPDARAYFRALVETLARRPGLAGAHLLRHERPPIAATTEQKIRGMSDQVADWVLVCCGYDAEVLAAVAADELGAQALREHGVAAGEVRGRYALSYSATPADVADLARNGADSDAT